MVKACSVWIRKVVGSSPTTPIITVCNSDGFRELASDARGRWFESSHTDTA